MILDVFLNPIYDYSEIIKKSGDCVATDKRQFTLRIQDDTYEKIRYLAYYISAYEKDHGIIPVPAPSEE